MNKTELLEALEATVPPLKGKLHIERVLYKKEANKAYVSFLCDELVGERDYLLLENRLRQRCMQNHTTELKDAIMRSYGIMRYAVSMDEKELMQHWSNLRLGAALELLPHSIAQIDRLLTIAQDAHVRQYIQRQEHPVDVKEARCQLIQEALAHKQLPAVPPAGTDAE